MAFSLNPGTSGPSGGQGIAPVVNPSEQSASLPSVPDSPFLFMQYRGREAPVTSYIQIVLLVVSVLSVFVCVTLYGYSLYLTSSIESKKAELASAEVGFKDYPFEEMKRFSNRLAALNNLMKDYISVRSPLKFLESVVEDRVVFDDFTLSRSGPGYVIRFTIITNNYRTIIQQLAALNLTEYNKVAPKPKPGSLVGAASDSIVKIQVTSPIFVQGVLPDAITFVAPASTSSGPLPSSSQAGSTTPQ